MNAQLVQYIRGYVRLHFIGAEGAFERLINRLVERNIVVWDIRRKEEGRGECSISLPDFFRLKPFLKETGCRMRVKGRFGFPFFLDKLGRRKWFVIGAALFFIGLYMLSQVVWSVEIDGNDTIPREQILLAAETEGIYPLQWKFRMGDPGRIADRLARSIPNVAWVGVDVEGATVTIRVVEAVIPKKRIPQNPRHLVSTSDAVITRIIADRGVPMVNVHSRVKQGDVLISGILGDEENREAVVAEGDVRGIVWYEYKVEVPIVKQHQALTGESQSSFHLVFGNRALKLTGYGQEPYQLEQVDADRKQLRFGPWTAPIGWMTVTRREAVLMEEKRTAAEAKETGLKNARADLIAKLGGNSVIRMEKILHEGTDNGKVVLNLLFEAEVDLASERLITQEELAPPVKKEGP